MSPHGESGDDADKDDGEQTAHHIERTARSRRTLLGALERTLLRKNYSSSKEDAVLLIVGSVVGSKVIVLHRLFRAWRARIEARVGRWLQPPPRAANPPVKRNDARLVGCFEDAKPTGRRRECRSPPADEPRQFGQRIFLAAQPWERSARRR